MNAAGVRLVVLDIDGTLLTSDKRVTPRTRAAIDAVRAAGVHVVLATGRRYPSARPVHEDLRPGRFLIVHNGALLLESGEVIRCRPLAREVARRAVLLARERGLDAVVHCGQGGEGLLVVEAGARRTGLVAYYLERSREHVREVADAGELLEDPMQVMLGGTPETLRGLRAELAAVVGAGARIERTVYPKSGVEILDVLDASVGKAAAVAFLQERLSITPAETLAIGDNWNDREMVEQAGRGFVMGGGDPELLVLGLPMLPSSDEDGVAIALEEHVL